MSFFELLEQILPRFIRLNQGLDKNLELQHHDDQFCYIKWLPGFICIPGTIPLRDFQETNSLHCAFPMNAASAICANLLLSSNDSQDILQLLDLCCCPGAKFQMIGDLLNDSSLMVGVDISSNRIDLFKSLMKKTLYHRMNRLILNNTDIINYDGKINCGVNIKSDCVTQNKLSIPRQLVFMCDGTLFNTSSNDEKDILKIELGTLRYDSIVAIEEIGFNFNRYKSNKSSRAREKKRLDEIQQSFYGGNDEKYSTSNDCSKPMKKRRNEQQSQYVELSIPSYFDLVLVDAECTHDASYSHMKFINNNSEIENNDSTKLFKSFKPHASLSSEEDRDKLYKLQCDLIKNGFKQLKNGGVLVYSTCSQEESQNEDVIRALLENEPTALLIDIANELTQNHIEKINDDNHSFDGNRIEDILSLSSEDLHNLLKKLSQTEVQELSIKVCSWCSSLSAPIFRLGTLPQTIKLGYFGGLSGHFIAKIYKSTDSVYDKVL
eukprot:gene4149-5909_t